MARRKKPLTRKNPLRDLQRTLNRLKDDQTDATRKKVRAELLAEIRRVKAFVDKEWPAPKRVVKKRKKMTVWRERQADGWVECTAGDMRMLEEACEFAGVTVMRRFRKSSGGKERELVLIPGWAVGAAEESNWRTLKDLAVRLRELRKSKYERDAIEVRVALRE